MNPKEGLSRTEARLRWAWALGAALAALLWRLPSLNLLLDRDEGEYATLAWLWRSGAGLPYRDWLEQKPPLAVGMNVLAQGLCPDGVLGLRLVSLAWIVATVLALFFLTERLASRGRLGWRLLHSPRLRAAAGGLAALTAALLLSTGRTQALAANTETWQTLPLLGALAVLFVPERWALRPRHYVCAGLCIGSAALFKQTAFAAVLVLPWAAQDRDGNFLKCVGWTLLGALAPWVLCWGFFEIRGAGLDFLNCVLAYNQTYVLDGFRNEWRRALGLALRLAPELWAWVGLAWLGWRALGAERASRRWLGAWLVLALVALSASGRFYPHYAVLLLAPLGLLAGLGLLGLWRGAPGWAPAGASRGLRWVLLAAALGSYAYADGGLWARPSAAQRTLSVYGLASFVNAPGAAQKLDTLCPADKNLFIWGDEAELYYLARRRPATRFLFTYPFTGEAPPWPGGEDELLRGLYDADTGAAVLCKGLDPGSPFQQSVFKGLQTQYAPDNGSTGFVLGVHKQ